MQCFLDRIGKTPQGWPNTVGWALGKQTLRLFLRAPPLVQPLWGRETSTFHVLSSDSVTPLLGLHLRNGNWLWQDHPCSIVCDTKKQANGETAQVSVARDWLINLCFPQWLDQPGTVKRMKKLLASWNQTKHITKYNQKSTNCAIMWDANLGERK